MEIKVLPNLVIKAEPSETLMNALVRYGLPVQNVCNGKGTCGKCKVRITGTVPAPTDPERKHLNETELSAGIRLACAVTPEPGMTVEMDFGDNLDRKEAALLGMKVPGVSNLELSGLSVSFLFKGDINRVLKKLSEVSIANLLVIEPELEEIFMHYYTKED